MILKKKKKNIQAEIWKIVSFLERQRKVRVEKGKKKLGIIFMIF